MFFNNISVIFLHLVVINLTPASASNSYCPALPPNNNQVAVQKPTNSRQGIFFLFLKQRFYCYTTIIKNSLNYYYQVHLIREQMVQF